MSVPEIQPADAKRRRQLVALAIVLLLVAGCVALLFEQHAQAINAQLESVLLRYGSQPLFAPTLGLFMAAPWVVVAVALFRFGSAVARFERLPPPGYLVIRDTEIIRGSKARSRGRLLRIAAATIGVLGTGVGLIMMALIRSLA